MVRLYRKVDNQKGVGYEPTGTRLQHKPEALKALKPETPNRQSHHLEDGEFMMPGISASRIP